jgi:hypothetical protein
MRQGVWHQFGHNSQTLALEQLQGGRGVGVVLSPRDLSLKNAADYATQYAKLGAEVLVDQQFFVPGFSNKHTATYPTEKFRKSLSKLRSITDSEVDALAATLQEINRGVGASAVLAPAVCYEAGRPETYEVNAALFGAAQRAGQKLGIPVYATVMLGSSAIASWDTVVAALDEATALAADGWYFGFEFMQDRIPDDLEATLRCCMAGLKLACTGRPVLHAFAGPMCLLSFCFGATGATIGHAQNLWQFTRTRWQPSTGGGGGGDAPARFFSSKLWGTIVYPDEIARMEATIAAQVLTKSDFTRQLTTRSPFPAFSRHDSYKHLLAVMCESATRLTSFGGCLQTCKAVEALLRDAVALHGQIEAEGVVLSDETSAYQENWRQAIVRLQRERKQDFNVLALQGR